MQRASIIIKIEEDGIILAEHEFGQYEPNLDDLREMFLTTLFNRLQKLGNDVFDRADEKIAELKEAKDVCDHADDKIAELKEANGVCDRAAEEKIAKGAGASAKKKGTGKKGVKNEPAADSAGGSDKGNTQL